MKPAITWAATPVALIALFCALNCSQPLNDSPSIPGNPTGGSNTTDTVVVHDTIVVKDSVYYSDTTVIIDTITIIDTVIVELPDTSATTEICSRLGSQRQELVWLLANEGGQYRLEFLALAEKLQPNQVVLVDVDGAVTKWIPEDNSTLILEVALGSHAVIKVSPECPSAFGHAIDVCLWITAL
jgi:hypothetical protein